MPGGTNKLRSGWVESGLTWNEATQTWDESTETWDDTITSHGFVNGTNLTRH